MANVHGLFSNRGKKDDENDDDDDDTNNRYVGGIGARGGGRYECIVLSISRHEYDILLEVLASTTQIRLLFCFFTYYATELYSGLAVLPNPNELGGSNSNTTGAASRDIVFGLAQEASGGDGENSEEQVRRTITMVTYDLSDNAFHMSHVNAKSYLSRYSLSLTYILVSKWLYCGRWSVPSPRRSSEW